MNEGFGVIGLQVITTFSCILFTDIIIVGNIGRGVGEINAALAGYLRTCVRSSRGPRVVVPGLWELYGVRFLDLRMVSFKLWGSWSHMACSAGERELNASLFVNTYAY